MRITRGVWVLRPEAHRPSHPEKGQCSAFSNKAAAAFEPAQCWA